MLFCLLMSLIIRYTNFFILILLSVEWTWMSNEISIMWFIERVEWTVLHMMKSMQIVERSRRLLYLYTANVTESRRAIFFLTLVYEELLETSLSSHFSTLSLDTCKFLSFHCFSVSVVQWISWSFVEIVTWSICLLSYLD